MNRFGLADFHHGNAHIYAADHADGGLALHMKGSLYIADPTTDLLPYLQQAQRKLREQKSDHLWIDLAALELMSSSSLRILIRFLKDIDRLPPGERYHVTIQYSPKVTWQEAQIPMFETLQPDLIRLCASK